MLCVAVSRSGWLLLLPSVALLPRAHSCARRSYRPLHVTVEARLAAALFFSGSSLNRSHWTGTAWYGFIGTGVRGRTQWYILWSLMVSFYLSYLFLRLVFLVPFLVLVFTDPYSVEPVTNDSCPEVFYRTMMTNMFLEVASVVCYGVHVAVTSFSSSLAGKVAVAILFEILRCSCLLGFSVQLSFGVATLRV